MICGCDMMNQCAKHARERKAEEIRQAVWTGKTTTGDVQWLLEVLAENGVELQRLNEKLESALAVSARAIGDREKLVESHGELAVELGRALFKIRRLEEDKAVLTEKLKIAEINLALRGEPN